MASAGGRDLQALREEPAEHTGGSYPGLMEVIVWTGVMCSGLDWAPPCTEGGLSSFILPLFKCLTVVLSIVHGSSYYTRTKINECTDRRKHRT